MSMTKKDFEVIATAIRKEREIAVRDYGQTSPQAQAISGVQYRLNGLLSRLYPQYDEAKFLEACTVQPETKNAFNSKNACRNCATELFGGELDPEADGLCDICRIMATA